MAVKWHRGEYFISTDKSLLDVELIHEFLSEEAYWAKSRTREVMERAIQHSLCFGIYQRGAQVGFARVVTDYATFAYLADVFVLEPHRSRGLGKFLVETILNYEPLATCGWTLFTMDAHGLYARYGFENTYPERLMRRKPVELPS